MLNGMNRLWIPIPETNGIYVATGIMDETYEEMLIDGHESYSHSFGEPHVGLFEKSDIPAYLFGLKVMLERATLKQYTPSVYHSVVIREYTKGVSKDISEIYENALNDNNIICSVILSADGVLEFKDRSTLKTISLNLKSRSVIVRRGKALTSTIFKELSIYPDTKMIMVTFIHDPKVGHENL